GAERLGPAPRRVAQLALQEPDDAGGDVVAVRVLGEVVGVGARGDQVQGQVSDDLAGRGDLHQAPEDRVGRRVQALDLLEAVPESERDGLLPQVGQLPAGDLVLVDAPGR